MSSTVIVAECRKTDSTQKASASDRRSATRYAFIADVEVIEISSGARVSTRTCDLALGGCYVDTIVPFPIGTRVRLRILNGRKTFETKGTVTYCQSRLGMGISFSDFTFEQQVVLGNG